jgi:hypothetical protein
MDPRIRIHTTISWIRNTAGSDPSGQPQVCIIHPAISLAPLPTTIIAYADDIWQRLQQFTW